MYEYLYLLPMAIIYSVLFLVITPRIDGKGAKFIVALVLIPISFFLTKYVDHYFPNLLYRFLKIFFPIFPIHS